MGRYYIKLYFRTVRRKTEVIEVIIKQEERRKNNQNLTMHH